jgi:hypothetical protein
MKQFLNHHECEKTSSGGPITRSWCGTENLNLHKVCDIAKIIFHIQVLVTNVFFSNPTNKTETGTASTWGTTNSKPLGPIRNYLANQKETRSSQ